MKSTSLIYFVKMGTSLNVSVSKKNFPKCFPKLLTWGIKSEIYKNRLRIQKFKNQDNSERTSDFIKNQRFEN